MSSRWDQIGAGAEWETEVCLFCGDVRREVIDEARRWLGILAGRPGVSLADLAGTLARRLRPGTLRLAIVAATLPELMSKLERAAELLADPSQREISDPRGIYYAEEPLARRGRVAFVFPGDGSPYLNMLADLVALFPEVRAWFETADRVAVENGRVPYSQVLFPGPLTDPRERWRAEHALRRLENGASVVLACNHALYMLLRGLGVQPDALIGHSLGDWSALGAAGVTSVDNFLRNMDEVLHLPRHVTRAGARMALAIADRDTIEQVLSSVAGEVYVAMHNGPRRVVIAGAKAAVREALDRLAALGAPTYRLPFVRAAHTPMTIGICEPMSRAFASFGSYAPNVELWSCTTARPYPPDADEIRRIAVENLVRPVEFVRTVEHAYAAGIRVFVECGAGGQLADCVTDILGDRPHLALATDLRQRRGVTQLNHVLGGLAAHGVDLELDRLFEGRAVEAIEAPEPHAPPRRPVAPPPHAREQVSMFLRETASAMESHLASVRATLAASTAFCEQFLAAQEEVLTSFYRRSETASPPAEPAGWPFCDRIAELIPGRRAVVRHRLDPATQPYLVDHRIGGFASHGDETPGALTLVPLTVTVEMMAEAAALLCPGQPLRGARRINARRELSGELRPELEFVAAPADDGFVRVEVIDVESGLVCADGEYAFGPRDPAPEPAAGPTDAAPSPLSAEELYSKHIMFHGPCFQGVCDTGEQSADGLCGRLRSLPRRMLLGSDAEPPMLTDPALLDAMGQLFGYWPLVRLAEDVVVFPAQIHEIQVFADPPQPGEESEMRLRLDECRPRRLVGTVDLLHEGSVWMRVHRWTFWRFNWPWPLVRMVAWPDRLLAADTLEERLGLDLQGCGTGVFATARPLELPLWVARVVLARDEFERLRQTPTAHRQQDQYLAGRIAAKDAVRRWLVAQGRVAPEPNHIAVLTEESGAPRVVLRDGSPAPRVSIAHKPGLAVAVAAAEAVGVDVELVAARDDAFRAAAFAADEHEALSGDVALTAAWAAKEAVAKRLGIGLGDPRRFRARPLADDCFEVTSEHGTETVRTASDGLVVVAVARG